MAIVVVVGSWTVGCMGVCGEGGTESGGGGRFFFLLGALNGVS